MRVSVNSEMSRDGVLGLGGVVWSVSASEVVT